MSGNSGSAPRGAIIRNVDIGLDMRRYDRLPRVMRDALKEIPIDMGTAGLNEGLAASRADPAVVAREMRAYAREMYRQDMIETFGRVP